MINFEVDAHYRLDERKEMLKGYVELPTFLQGPDLRRYRVFRDAVWGWEILGQARRAPAYTSLTDQAPFNHHSTPGTTKSGGGKKDPGGDSPPAILTIRFTGRSHFASSGFLIGANRGLFHHAQAWSCPGRRILHRR